MIDEQLKNEYFKRIFKAIRKEKKLTQKKLGEIIGKKEITIRKYELGHLKVSIETLYILIKKLNILKTEFLNIAISLDVIAGLVKDSFSPDKDQKNYITEDFITQLIIELFSDSSEMFLSLTPNCPSSLDLETNTLYKENLNKYCLDSILFYITQLSKLENININDKVKLELSKQGLNYLNFLLKEKGIIK